MKLHRSLPNNSDGIFSVSFSVRSPFVLRSGIEDRSKNDRRNIGESSEARRRCIETLTGSQGKGNPNKNFIFASNDFLKSVRHCDTKKYFFPINTGGVSRF